MIATIAFVSQKGGVAKSTLARAFAVEAAKNDLSVKIADLDTRQATTTEWHRLRLHNKLNPVGSVEIFSDVTHALKNINSYDVLVIDGAGLATAQTLKVAQLSNLLILPTCASRDDLSPVIKLAYELESKGISRKKMAVAITRVATETEIKDAKSFVEQAGFIVLDGCLYEKPAYRQAQDKGLAVNEISYKSLREKINPLITNMSNLFLSIIDQKNEQS